MSDTLEKLQKLLEQRKGSIEDNSYVASLYKKGIDAILKKVGEETSEVIIAAKNTDQKEEKQELIYEMADLWFHSMVLLCQQGTSYQAVLSELERRFGTSGIEEKNTRIK